MQKVDRGNLEYEHWVWSFALEVQMTVVGQELEGVGEE